MFLDPHFLWLLPLPLLLAAYQLRRADSADQHRIAAAGLRLLSLSMVILALAQPIQKIPETVKRTVAVVDCSPSMDDSSLTRVATEVEALAERAGHGNTRLVVFGAHAREVEMGADVPTATELVGLRSDTPGSAVAEALELAAALCPDDAYGDVHLFSDGRETRGDMVSAAVRLGRRGLVLKTHEMGALAASPVLLRRVRGPCTAAVGEAVTLVVEVECQTPGTTEMRVADGKGDTVSSRAVPLRAGTQEVPFQVRPEQSGLQYYKVSLADGDQSIDAGLEVRRTVIGVFETAPEAPAARAFEDLLGAHANIKPLTLADLTNDGWDGFDVLALADTPAAELPPEVQQRVRHWVENGGGLLVTGGRNAFGPGGYSRSELAEMLPLRFPQKKEVRDPSTSLAIIIDTSGSMGAEGVSLAKEVSRLALQRLKPHDKAGIVEFHGAKRWAAPMQPASNSIAIQRALNRLSPGGGTVMLPAIEEAYYGLLNVHTRTRHVLVLTDGGVETGAFESLLRRMTDDGIHVSTVLVGPRAGSSFLAQLASWGRGQFYTAPSRFKLPEVIVKQPSSSLLSPFVEKEVRLEPGVMSPLTQDLEFDGAPVLRGYVKTEAKDTAEVLLQSDAGDPVLARWHYGLGRVAILTTQLGGTWAEDILNWPPAHDLMANLTRQLGGVSPRQPLALDLAWSSAGLELSIRAHSPDSSLATVPLWIEIRDESEDLIAMRTILPTRAHTWQALFEDLPPGRHLVEIKASAEGKVLAAGGVVVPPPNEFTRAEPDRERLAAAARAARESASSLDGVTAPGRTRELWPVCAALGLLFFILMILVRRLPSKSSVPRSAPASTAGLAFLVALWAMGAAPEATAQEVEASPSLTSPEAQRIDAFIEMEPGQARQELKTHCRELLRHYGELHPLCEYLKSKGEDGEARRLLVVAAMAEGNLDLAHSTLGSLIAQPDPDLWELSEMARVQDMRGEREQALETLARALKQTTDAGMRFAMLIRTAQLLYDEDRHKEARAAIRDILTDANFNRPEGRNYCARIAGLHGDYELVEELFTPVGEARELMRDRIYFGEILMKQDKPVEAGEQFSAALALSRLPRDRRYILDRIVSAAREAGNLAGLMDEWLTTEEILPQQLDILVSVLGGELDRVGDTLALLERGDLPTGTQKLIQSPAFQERMVMTAMEAGMSALARRQYLDLIARHPKDFHYHNGYARLLLMEGERAEAEEFFRETVATTETVGGLMALAVGAQSMALGEVALEAATKAGAMGDLAHVQAVLFEAGLHRQYGATDRALETLQALEEEIGDDAELMMPLAEAYERYDYQAQTIRVVRKAYDLTGNESTLEKLITLMEAQQQYEQAFVLYRQLWETATEPMAVIQAQDRLLDIGSKNGKLADIAIELEERLDEGGLNDRELGMLLEIYTSVNDPVSAADILMEVSHQDGRDRVDLYLRLVQVYMECELFGRCNAVLHKLIELDPANRDDYLQSLTLIALESKNDGDAVAILQELAARTPGGVLRDSFSASVLNMIGRPEEAARAYRRSLAENPDEVEAWLLWGNSLAAKDDLERRRKNPRLTSRPSGATQKQATGMFSVLLEASAEDDMFTIALDGLLNANAPESARGAALRRVYERIAVKPHKMYLYRLAADLLEEMQRPDDVRAILEQGLVVADDGRGIILRELIALTKNARQDDKVILYGRSLLNTSEHLPPNECLELGSLLLAKGHISEADNAFRRVIADGDTMGVTRDIILIYENAGLYGKAGKLLRQLLVGNPFDVELILRLGIMEEKKGNFSAAAKAYLRSLDLMIGRLPRSVQKVDGADGWAGGPRYQRTHNVTELDQYYELAVRGAIMSALTPVDRQALLEAIQDRVRTELSGLEADDAFSPAFEENARLVRLTDLMRRLAFVFHRPEYCDPMDDDLLKRYHMSDDLVDRLQSQRRARGLSLNAREFLARNGRNEDGTMVLSPYLDDPDKLREILTDQEMSRSHAETVLPLLVMSGHDDLVELVLAKIGQGETPQATAIPLSAVGLAANRPALIRETLFNALAGARGNARLSDPTWIQNLIATAWPLLSAEDRNSVANQYGMIAEKVSSSYKRNSRAFHSYLLCQVGRSQDIALADVRYHAKGYAHDRTSEAYAWAAVTRWLVDKPDAQRPEALEQLLASHDQEARAATLEQLAMLLDDDVVTDELAERFRQIYEPTKLSAQMAKSTQLVFSSYRKSRLTNLVGEVMGDRHDGDLGSALLAADGSMVDMDKVRTRVSSEITSQTPLLASDIRMAISLHDGILCPAADMLPPEQLNLILKERVGSSDPIDLLIAFLLQRRAGREAEALATLHRIGSLPADDPQVISVRAILPRFLIRYGWDTQAYEFRSGAGDEAITAALLPFRLSDPLTLLEGGAPNALDASIRRMHAGLLMSDPVQFLHSTRIYSADSRHPSLLGNSRIRYQLRTLPPRMAGAVGGLLGLKSGDSGTIFDDLGKLSGGQDELSRWLSGASTATTPSRSALCQVLASSVHQHGLGDMLHDEIRRAAEGSLLSNLDIAMITAIASEAPEQLPKALADQMAELIVAGKQSDSRKTGALGKASKALGISAYARSLSRWSVAIDIQTKGTSRWLEDYLGSLPEHERRDTLKMLLPHLGINAIRRDACGDEDVLFRALLDHGLTDEASDLLDRYLQRLSLIDARSRTGYRLRSSSPVEPGGETLHDAMAIALARLDRSDDYRGLLRRQAILDQRSTTQKQSSTSFGRGLGGHAVYENLASILGPGVKDHTRALPEPDQVKDINTYIDIHLNVIGWLRAVGRLSREGRVARLCMLGRWCVERNLRGRAAEILALADSDNNGMLTGRLWIADLHRLLGQEEPADAIERELLRHNLLPVSRAPAALRTLAGKEGDDQADAIAYPIASYTNHPEILPMALRHAQSQGLKAEARDLAERLRKVGTLFLPE